MDCLLSGPTDDLAREKIHDHGQIQPALPRSDVGDVRDPRLVRLGHCELTLQSIRDEDVWFSHRQMANTIAVQCLQSVFPHQSADAMFAARLAEFTKILQDSRRTVNAVAGGKRCANTSQ